ncbi:uncharacterized protein LOC112340993 [Selaginella moellendorffii]|uniref:uncharacterized protein LOC112340993 n=1 Tax=Selaginella moellendorffii TaxID=88036 RepID=UPI000D1C9306|nr:uncharacterized protein LOC112340993 [Selaginella moellendorffii]|eukprot:XP_024516105.1 uncharacterized protein LOC112340993 [Selaginella moellendorffii]
MCRGVTGQTPMALLSGLLTNRSRDSEILGFFVSSMALEEDPLEALPDSSSESDASPTFSFPCAPSADLHPMPLRLCSAGSGFSFDVVDRGDSQQQEVLELPMPEVTKCWEVDSASSSSISEIVELVETGCNLQEEAASGDSPGPDRGSGEEKSASPSSNGSPSRKEEGEDRSLPARAESARHGHGILGQLIGTCDDIDRHCDVLDVVRKGVHNWRMVARMSGWLACRGCCHRPANCCHHSTGSPKSPGGHSRKLSQDTTASTNSNSSNCCAKKSTLSPLRQHHPEHSSSFSKRESLAATTATPATPGPCCVSNGGRRSGATPLRSFKLSSSDELSVHVPPGMIGLAWLDTEPLLLTSKSYTFPATSSFSLQELALESTRVLHHGYLHRVSILEGKLGVAWIDGQAKVLEPGVHVLSCSSFAYTTADDRDSSHKEVALGPYRVVTVREDEVGIKYCNRKPHLLYAGRHLIDISKVEVFAGFESLKIRKTTASDLVACSRDEMMVEAQVSFRWQISAQDIAFARGASVPDIENAVIAKVKRAFAIVFWCLRGDEITEPYSQVREDGTLHISGPMKAFSSDITKKCLEAVVDLFDEGWSVTFWGMWFETLKLKRYSRIRPMKGLQDVQLESKNSMARKKKVQIVLTED